MKKVTCCLHKERDSNGKEIETTEVKVTKQGDLFVYACPTCGKQSEGKTPLEASEKEMKVPTGPRTKSVENKPVQSQKKPDVNENNFVNIPVIQKPTSPTNLSTWADQHLPELIKKSASFQDKPATSRMIKKNVDYVTNHKGLSKCWTTPEGQDSITKALEDSFWMGAMMPEMGSIVPYGTTCEFIPAVEAFNFALTTGKNNPFQKIDIIVIHKNDIYDIGRKDGQFYCTVKQGFPRGEVLGVVVMGLRSDGITVGESYDVNRLLEKAKTHSPSYRAYLNDLNEFRQAQVEGKTKRQGDREYFVKVINKKDGGTWEKTIYLDELVNPYEGADQPEMLRKSAGKSFLNPYMKIRNSMSMAGEWTENENENNEQDLSTEKKIDSILQTAKENVTVPEKVETVFEGEIVDEGDRI
jgi:uncharacterized Zn finger protein (UPF0148 family)